jgi:glycosyltransferase involved in cell wall biosynthesis
VDRCGSARPGNLLSNFSRIQREIQQAQQIPTYTVSGFLNHRMVRAGCPSDAITTIRSPAPEVTSARDPVPRGEVPRFLYLGRLVPQKGPGWLLRALAETDVPVHLDIAGDGPRRADLERLAHDLGIGPDVTFHGWVDRERVPVLMDRCRAVVFPSRWHEPAGLITLEAAAHGRALIASRVGGIPEYADEAHAFLVEAGDTQALAEALSRLATDADRADRMGERGRAVARSDFAVSPFLDRLDTLYNQAASARDDHTTTPREIDAQCDEC